MRLGAIAVVTLALLLATEPAEAAKRVALVIGNNDYENVPKLRKAVNDAAAISKELAKLGFEVVTAQDVGRRAMSRALVELEGKIGPGDTALVYFAGHGFAVDGTNYLLPVDVPPAGPGRRPKCASLPPRSIMCRCPPITIRSSATCISRPKAR